MSIAVRLVDNIVVLTVEGQFLDENEAYRLHEKIRSLVHDEIRNVVVDLGFLRQVNSIGLGVLCACHITFSSSGGRMVLAQLTKRTKMLLVITKLADVLDSYDSLDDAVQSFESISEKK